ncbi:MAG: Uma2 family endonuclease [Bacteroidota bacterium]|nr:Uma2 family endonuclease [Bacteroidota bacterium]
MNFVGEVRNFLKGKPCQVFGSDLRVHIPSNSLFTYPDALIVCGKPELLNEERDTLLNPVVIVEILSKSTQSYPGNKFMLYRAIPSLKEYILISSEVVQVEHYSKQEDGTWLLKEWKNSTDVWHLQSLDFPLPLTQLYDGVDEL